MNKVRVLDLESYLDTYFVDEFNIIAVDKGKELEVDSYEVDLEGKLEEIEKGKIAEHAKTESEEEGMPPSWVQERIILGAYGEKVVLNYLNTLFDNVKLVSDEAYKGYDIEITDKNIIGVEVKTSIKSETIHVTYNQLEKAQKMKEYYYLFYVQINPKTKAIYGYIIKNLITALNIDFEQLTRLIELENTYILPSQFIIKFKPGFLEELVSIDLTPYDAV